jgi:hypothetical protein
MVPDDYESDADEKSIPRPIAALDQPILEGLTRRQDFLARTEICYVQLPGGRSV